jgi:hypothetical protein
MSEPDAVNRYGDRLDEALQFLTEDVEDNPNSTRGIVAQTALSEIDRLTVALSRAARSLEVARFFNKNLQMDVYLELEVRKARTVLGVVVDE